MALGCHASQVEQVRVCTPHDGGNTTHTVNCHRERAATTAGTSVQLEHARRRSSPAVIGTLPAGSEPRDVVYDRAGVFAAASSIRIASADCRGMGGAHRGCSSTEAAPRKARQRRRQSVGGNWCSAAASRRASLPAPGDHTGRQLTCSGQERCEEEGARSKRDAFCRCAPAHVSAVSAAGSEHLIERSRLQPEFGAAPAVTAWSSAAASRAPSVAFTHPLPSIAPGEPSPAPASPGQADGMPLMC